MSLYAYNKTAAPLALAAGNPIVTLPAASSAGARGDARNVTGELRPDLTVDPINGVVGGLSAADFALLQVQVAAGQVEYEWTSLPEYQTSTLVIGSASYEIAENPINIYCNGPGGTTPGNDDNPGTFAQPVATLERAMAMVPAQWRRWARIILDSDGTARTYNFQPTGTLASTQVTGGQIGLLATPLTLIGLRTTLVVSQAETAGGSNNTVNGAGFGATDSLLGRYVRVLTGALNTTLSANISATDTTIPVAATAGFPAAANAQTPGVASVNGEYFFYQGTTPTTFTGCVRGILGTTAAAHSSGATVNGGANVGQRRQIKSNTGVAVTTTTNFPTAFTIGDTYVIDGPGTQIDSDAWRPARGALGMKDIKINMLAAPPAPVGANGNFYFPQGEAQFYNGCEIIINSGNNLFIGVAGSFFDTAVTTTWSNDGLANNPFPAAENNCGLLVTGPGTCALHFGYLNSNFAMVANGASVSILTNAGIRQNGIYTFKNGTLTIDNDSYVGFIGSSSNKLRFDGVQVTVQGKANLVISQADISNSPASAILAKQNAYVQLTACTGLTNTRYAVEVTDNATMRVTDTTETSAAFTGTLGDIKCGNRPVRTWADFFSATPGSGLPSKNEYDSPGFVARPFKLAFAGMAAAASFDITTLAANATPVGANATTSSIWQTTPPALANVNTLRVTGVGTAALGTRTLSDTGGTPSATVATVSDDGKTITFEGTVTDFTLEYTPVSGNATGARVYQN